VASCGSGEDAVLAARGLPPSGTCTVESWCGIGVIFVVDDGAIEKTAIVRIEAARRR